MNCSIIHLAVNGRLNVRRCETLVQVKDTIMFIRH